MKLDIDQIAMTLRHTLDAVQAAGIVKLVLVFEGTYVGASCGAKFGVNSSGFNCYVQWRFFGSTSGEALGGQDSLASRRL